MRTRYIAIILGLFIIRSLQAQEQPGYEFSVNLGGGISTLQYPLNYISPPPTGPKVSLGIGGMGGIGYTGFFSPQLGFSTGLEWVLYNSKATMNELFLRYPMVSPLPPSLSDEFFLRANYKNFQEEQKAQYIQIPLLFQVQTPPSETMFYFRGGVKIGFPLSGSYKASTSELTTTGYSNYTGQIYENMHGFGVYPNVNYSGDLKFNTAFLLSVETGLKWRLSETSFLYTGAYLDYGLNNIVGNATKNLINYDSPPNYEYSSLLQAQQPRGNEQRTLIDKVVPFSLGLKLNLSFGGGKGKSVAEKDYDTRHEDVSTDWSVEERQKELVRKWEESRKKEDSAWENTPKKPIDSEKRSVPKKQTDLEKRKSVPEKRNREEPKSKKQESGRLSRLEELKRQDEEFMQRQGIAKEKSGDEELAQKRETPVARPERLTQSQRNMLQRAIRGYTTAESGLNDNQKAALNEAIVLLKSYPNLNITIEGHTCNLEKMESSDIGLARANKAKEYMVSQGIAADRITPVGKGDCCPLKPNNNSENRSFNRRIQIVPE